MIREAYLLPIQGTFDRALLRSLLESVPYAFRDEAPQGRHQKGDVYRVCEDAGDVAIVQRLRREQPNRVVVSGIIDVAEQRILVFQDCSRGALTNMRSLLQQIEQVQPFRILDRLLNDISASGVAGLYGGI